MIRCVRADRASFKTVYFQPGMNVVLATRTQESTDKDSTNGSGKSTLVEIIHFCMGGSIDRGKGLGKQQLLDWTFTLDLDIAGETVSVSRNTKDPRKVFLEGNYSAWPVAPKRDKATGRLALSVPQWTRVLGTMMFGLGEEEHDFKYGPSFRSLISYFVRRGGQVGGFLSPFTHFARQKEWDKQVHNSFLLELEWEQASKWQVLKDREKVLTQIKAEATSGILANLVGSIGALEADRIILEKREREEAEQLASFQVHPQYQQIETEANRLTKLIQDKTNESVMARRVLESYDEGLRQEKEPSAAELAALYQEAGVVLPHSVTKTYDEVAGFHHQIVENRQEFLQMEIDRLKRKISAAESEVRALSEERAEKLVVLRAHGALDEYSRLQQRHAQTTTKLKDVAMRIEHLKRFEQGKSSLRIEKELLLQKARLNLEERTAQRLEAVELFNSNSEALYDAPGRLTVDVGPNGFVFDVDIKRSGSQGIDLMKVYCYDLMLAQMWSVRSHSPGFMIHDSTIFDGVDSRQVAKALQLSAKESQVRNFQYICMLNADDVPARDLDPDFPLQDFVRMRLTDATEDGGLLGIRF